MGDLLRVFGLLSVELVILKKLDSTDLPYLTLHIATIIHRDVEASLQSLL